MTDDMCQKKKYLDSPACIDQYDDSTTILKRLKKMINYSG